MCVCVCVCVCVWGVTWPEHRALRFHEIVCIREVRKTESYFLKSCDPVLATSLWRGQTASHRGVNHSLMLLAAADTSTLLFFRPCGPFQALSYLRECEDIYPHHSRSPCSDVQGVRAPGSDGWGDLWFFFLKAHKYVEIDTQFPFICSMNYHIFKTKKYYIILLNIIK